MFFFLCAAWYQVAHRPESLRGLGLETSGLQCTSRLVVGVWWDVFQVTCVVLHVCLLSAIIGLCRESNLTSQSLLTITLNKTTFFTSLCWGMECMTVRLPMMLLIMLQQSIKWCGFTVYLSSIKHFDRFWAPCITENWFQLSKNNQNSNIRHTIDFFVNEIIFNAPNRLKNSQSFTRQTKPSSYYDAML